MGGYISFYVEDRAKNDMPVVTGRLIDVVQALEEENLEQILANAGLRMTQLSLGSIEPSSGDD